MTEESIKKKDVWKPKDKRFVGFLDILGFKDYVLSNHIEEVYNRLKTLSKYTPDNDDENKNELALYESVKENIVVTIFSDSIIILSKNDSLTSFRIFSAYINQFLFSALSEKIPLKGAIAYGELYAEKSNTNRITCGQALIDAYLLEEELQYMGVIIHHSMEKYISDINEKDCLNDNFLSKDINKKFILDIYKEVKTPLKSGKFLHKNLDIFQIYATENIDDTINNTISEFKYTMSGAPRKYIDNTIFVIEQMKELRKKL